MIAHFLLCLFNPFFSLRTKQCVHTFFHFKTTYLRLSFTSSWPSLLLLSFSLHTLCYYSLFFFTNELSLLSCCLSLQKPALQYSLLLQAQPTLTFFYFKQSLSYVLYPPSMPSLPFITFFHSKQSLFTFFTTSRACHYLLLLQAKLVHIL